MKHEIGNFYKYRGRYFILSLINYNTLSLISLDDGCVTDVCTIKDILNITEFEWKCLSNFKNFELVELEIKEK